jgi:cytochrome b561
VEDISELADSGVWATEVSFGVALAAAFAVRWVWVRKTARQTRLSPSAPAWEKLVSTLVHRGLYIGVAAICGTGLAIAAAQAASLPDIVQTAAIGAHELSLNLTAALMGLHVLGAFWHKIVRRDGLMESMTGAWRFGRS